MRCGCVIVCVFGWVGEVGEAKSYDGDQLEDLQMRNLWLCEETT